MSIIKLLILAIAIYFGKNVSDLAEKYVEKYFTKVS